MNFVESLNILGVEGKEIPCIKGNGEPTSSTLGAVGLFYMDRDTGAVYKCIAATQYSATWVNLHIEVNSKIHLLEAKINENAQEISRTFDFAYETSEMLQAKDKELTSRIDRNSKRLTNLEAGIPDDDFVTDNSASYVRDVPTNALPYAEVSEIGGVTRKCTQLFDVDKAQIGYRCNIDGSVIKNTSYATSDYIEVRDGKSYYLTNVCGDNYCSAVLFDANKAYVNNISLGAGSKVNGVLNVDSNIKYIRINIFTDVVDINTVMVNEGETALPYEPYFSGLRSAPVSEVVSEGANSWNNEIAEYSDTDSFTRTSSGFIFKRSENLQGRGAYAYVKHPIKAGDTVVFNFTGATYAKYLYSDQIYGNQITAVPAGRELIYTADVDYPNALFAVVINSQDPDGEVSDITLNYDTSQPYTPYIKRTLTLPEAVQALPDYGVGIPNTDYFNRIRWRYDEQTDKWVRELVKYAKIIDMGAMAWSHNGEYWYCTDIASEILINWRAPNLLADNYNTHGWDGKATGDITMNGDGYIVVIDEDANKPTGKLVYALATPEITDISDLLPEDNLLGVEGGGTITAENEFGYDVPMTVTYQVDTEEVAG